MGRWSAVQLRGKKQEKIWFISAYRVSQDTLPGPHIAYAQQHKMLLDADVQDPRPKRQFIIDLTKFITDITKKHEHVILALDANEVLEPAGVPVKPTSITALQRDCGLQDVYKYQHESRGDTTSKKQHKIDHLLISPALLPAVIRSGFLPFAEILESDHRTGFADFDSTVLFGEEIPDLTNTANRKLHTKYPKRMAKYSKEVKSEFEQRGLF